MSSFTYHFKKLTIDKAAKNLRQIVVTFSKTSSLGVSEFFLLIWQNFESILSFLKLIFLFFQPEKYKQEELTRFDTVHRD